MRGRVIWCVTVSGSVLNAGDSTSPITVAQILSNQSGPGPSYISGGGLPPRSQGTRVSPLGSWSDGHLFNRSFHTVAVLGGHHHHTPINRQRLPQGGTVASPALALDFQVRTLIVKKRHFLDAGIYKRLANRQPIRILVGQ